jgi:hypothetical protein
MAGRDAGRPYRVRAQHCLDIAAGLDSSRSLVLLEMAQAWLRLAAQAERNQKNNIVYETPHRPPMKAHPRRNDAR